MKREQIEKINAALIALVDAVPACRNISVSRGRLADSEARIAFHVDTDDALQELAAVLGLRVSPTRQDDPVTPRWWLDASGAVGDRFIMIIGPTHFDSTPATDDAKVDAAIAQAQDAAAASSNVTRACERCGAALPRDHVGALCPFFCVDKVIGARHGA